MNWTFVSSSNINSIGHDGGNELHITFNNHKTYAYEGIQESEYVRIVNSERPSKEALETVKNKKYRVV